MRRLSVPQSRQSLFKFFNITADTYQKRCVHFAVERKTNRNDDNSPAGNGTRHHSSTENTSPAFSGDNATPRSLTNGTAQSNGRKGTQRRMSLSALMDSTAQRFISDLHPEAGFFERNSSDPRHPCAKATANVGVWVDKHEWDELIRQRDAAYASGRGDAPAGSSAVGRPSLPKPQASQMDGLVDVYFRKLHPILPFIDELEFREAYAAGVVPEPYVHAICLVAAKDTEAEPFLRHPDSETPIAPREFCSSLQQSVKQALAASSKYDRLTLIRMNALMSFHIEGPEGAEDASLFVTQAMHHCQTLGLHLGQQSSLPTRSTRPMKLLFWVIWTLDRFNAAINGRPIIMADHDIAIEPIEPNESAFPAFEILLRIAHIMNDVISFYRPGSPPTVTGWEHAFPAFEDLLTDLHGWSLAPPLLATLHIAYLATAILSHRSSSKPPAHPTTTPTPTRPPSHTRQTLSAIHLTRLTTPPRLPTLHALPILPYAISLALSVAYQRLRQDALRHAQEDARADFEACCASLRALRPAWSSADAMAGLAEKVLGELRRAPVGVGDGMGAGKEGRVLAGFANACRDSGEPVVDGRRNRGGEGEEVLGGGLVGGAEEGLGLLEGSAQGQGQGQGLFEGIDDIFGTYLDPNYPVNLEDLAFLDDLGGGEWAAPPAGV